MSRCCAAVIVLLAACAPLPPQPVGPLREVTVVSDRWYAVESVVTALVQQPVPTPQPEPEFSLRVGSPQKFDTYSRFRIVFLIGLPSDSLIRLVLGASADSLSADGYGLVKVPNPWVSGQNALIFVARAETLLAPGISVYAARIRQTLREFTLAQMTAAVYIEGVDRAKTDSLAGRYSFAIDVPKRWVLNTDAGANGFVYLYGHVPDRSVFAFWQDTVRPLDPAALAALRDSLTGRFYDGDSLEPEYLRSDSIQFLNVPALRLAGIWQNNREVIGGPFVSYAFNYQGRFFLLDGLVFNPGEKKLNGLAQVEAVLRTFLPR